MIGGNYKQRHQSANGYCDEYSRIFNSLNEWALFANQLLKVAYNIRQAK